MNTEYHIIPLYAITYCAMYRIQIKKKDQIVKEYVYREHADSWMHLSMLFKMSDHTPRATIHELQKRVYMNFLHDFSRDFNDGLFDLEKINSLPKVSILN